MKSESDRWRKMCACSGSHGLADVWRVTADDDPEKQWDSINTDDAFIDAEDAFDDGARKVTIERISPPNDQALPRGGAQETHE